MTKKVLLLALVASLVLGVFTAANAHTSGTFDGDDTVSKLDLASAKLSHTTRTYKGRVATHDPYTNKVLGATGEMYFDLDLAGTKRFDHYVWIDRASRTLTAKVFKVARDDLEDARFLVQGTLYPDVIESATSETKAAQKINHPNVGP